MRVDIKLKRYITQYVSSECCLTVPFSSSMNAAILQTLEYLCYDIYNLSCSDAATEIKRVVTDLTVSRYQVSKHWGDKYNIFIPSESDKLNELAYGNVLHLKLRVIQKHLDDNLKQLKEVKDIEEENRLLEFQKQLKSGEIEISNFLGIVIAR